MFLKVSFLVIGLFCLQWLPSGSAEGHSFCYDDTDSHCPGPTKWGGSCNDGSTQQSPIRLPPSATFSITSRSIDLTMAKYKGSTFSVKNNGHTVAIKLSGGDAKSSVALSRKEGLDNTNYKLDSAHFHWGKDDTVGSEHCLESKCYSMELHLVHYKSSFDSLDSAVKSSDSEALAVIGVMLDVSSKAGSGNKNLAPIIKTMDKLTSPSDWLDVKSELDFRPLLNSAGDGKLFTYKGSLTTPECNEKVVWYVYDRPVGISSKDVEKFRSINDSRGKQIKENNRPLQKRNSRGVYSVTVKQS